MVSCLTERLIGHDVNAVLVLLNDGSSTVGTVQKVRQTAFVSGASGTGGSSVSSTRGIPGGVGCRDTSAYIDCSSNEAGACVGQPLVGVEAVGGRRGAVAVPVGVRSTGSRGRWRRWTCKTDR